MTESDGRQGHVVEAPTWCDALPEAVLVLDDQWRVVHLNTPGETLLRCARATVVGQRLSDVLPALEPVRTTLTGGGTSACTDVALHDDGRWLNVRATRSNDGVVLLLLDVSSQKRLEALNAAQNRALERLATGECLVDLLNGLCLDIEGLVGGGICSIMVLTSGRLWVKAGPSIPPELVRELDGLEPGVSAASCGTAACVGEPVHASDTSTDRRWATYREFARRHGIRACWSIPILSRTNEVLATFAISHPAPCAPDETHLRILETTAHVAGIAIERSLEEDRLRLSEQRVRLLLDSTAEAIYGVDVDGLCTFCNPACLRMLGYADPGDLVGRNMPDLIHAASAGGAPGIGEAIHLETGTHRDDEMIRRADGSRFHAEYWAYPVFHASVVVGAVVTFLDITERHQSARRQRLLSAELDHRVKNNLTSVLALADRTLAESDSLATFRTTFTGRVQALARTHEALADAKWDGVSLDQVVQNALGPSIDMGARDVTMNGEEIMLPARTSGPLTLTLHELATNALKHGALSSLHGAIEVKWSRPRAGELQIRWTETGGPSVYAPVPDGVGTSLIHGLIEYELKGEVEMDYRREGLVCSLSVPLSAADLKTR